MTLNPISVQSSLAIHWVEFDKLSSIFTSPAHASLWTLELSSVHMSCNVFSEGFGPATHFRAALMRVCDQRPAFWFWAMTGTAFAMTHLPLALRFASCSFHPSWTTRSKTRRAVISPCARMISSLSLRFSKISNSFSRTRTSFSSFSFSFSSFISCWSATKRLSGSGISLTVWRSGSPGGWQRRAVLTGRAASGKLKHEELHSTKTTTRQTRASR